MHLLLLGASGRTGSLVLSTALAQNHTITALVRNPSAITTKHQNLTLITGTPLNPSDITSAIASSKTPIDAVIITLAVPRSSDSPFAKPTAAPWLIRDSVRNALSAMKTHTIPRIVVMSVLGAGNSWEETPWLVKGMWKHTNMSYVVQDHEAVDELLHGEKGKGVEWTLVRPPMLKDGDAKAVRDLGETGKGVGTFDSVTRASVAEVLVKAAVEGKWRRQAVVVAN